MKAVGVPAQDDIKLEFAYDYMGRRIEKRVYEYTTAWQLRETRRYLWAGWLLLAELDGSNNVVRKQTWGLDLAGLNGAVNSREAAGGIGGLLAIEQAAVGGGSTQGGLDAVDLVVLGDGNGNVTQLVAWASGYGGGVGFGWHTDRLAAHYEYTPYGGTVCDPGDAAASGPYAAENPWRFSTKQWDDEHGTPVGYWGYRYYDPRLGRWLSRDPIGEEGAVLVRRVAGASVSSFISRDRVADQSHLYRYVRNTPNNLVDPLGLQASAATSQPCCVCGPDITNALQQLFSDVDAKFAALNDQQKDDLCDGYIDAAHWDTDLFTRAGTFRTEGCPKGDACEFDNKVPGVKGGASVTVDGHCFASYDVNYVLYGRMTKNCGLWNQAKASFWFIIYKTPWWTSHSWTRSTQAAMWQAYGAAGGMPMSELGTPGSLKSCQPCGEEWDKPIHWYVYGDNNVSIRG